ncbi:MULTISPECIES: DUF805 domain-containing protein [Burkholderia]|uniref:DUF805 domain-containing protein n=1 Tax=Burkholderia TaxID=32008 RepID=UPI0009821BEF|nr:MULTISPECIES: DUF805 domain-containing protein [Burkholderia]AQQ42238.1 DUF805 domain-containing protein [Burkholderia cenocepacia]MBG0876375.1 DUF805 domain-containing protein [Burkholderia sp. 9775_39]MBG0885811.1 DUF805 domain-containing protein [Burkholderia sp. 9773_38]ONV24046.1 DUF805 domain-containing protein [Burkholderia cenocepacia]ONV24373.1 DUF805 domain-containing protein [Burkholderia cenocepacia]
MNAAALFSFRGRAGRIEWWGVTVPWLIAGSVLDVLADLPAAQRIATFVDVVGWAFAIVMIWMLVAVSVRRWHDIGKSGWWTLLHATPVGGAFITIAMNGFYRGDDARNRFGPPSPDAGNNDASL